MNLKELGCRIVEASYLEGNFVLSSGKQSHFYFDKYLFETRPDLLKPLVKEMSRLLPPACDFDLLAGPELGGVTLATGLSLEVNKPFIIVKKEAKNYGTAKLIEGSLKRGQKVVLVEDILTSGKQALEAAKKIDQAGGQVVLILGVIDRQEGASSMIAEAGYSLKTVYTRKDLGV